MSLSTLCLVLNQRFIPNPDSEVWWALRQKVCPSPAQVLCHGLSDHLHSDSLWSKVLWNFHNLLLFHPVIYKWVPASSKPDPGQACSAGSARPWHSWTLPRSLWPRQLLALSVCFLEPEWWTLGTIYSWPCGLKGWWPKQFWQHWPWRLIHYWAGAGHLWGIF